MTNHPIPDDHDAPAGHLPPTSALLRQAIEHVDQLLDRLDHAPSDPAPTAHGTTPFTSPVPDATIAARIAAVAYSASGPPGTPAQALAGGMQLMLLAHDAAQRMRSQAHQSSLDAALAGQRIITDATRAVAQLQADAQRSQAACDAWANELTCAADAAIDTIIGHPELSSDQSTPSTSGTAHADAQESGPRPDLEAAIDAAVQEMDAVEFGRRRRTSERH